MEAKYVRPEDYKRMELALGPAKAEAWRVKHDLIVGMPPEENAVDDNEPEDGAEEKDFAVAAPPSAAQRKSATAGDKGALAQIDAYGGYEEAQRNVMAQAQANLDLLKAGQEALRNRRLGPSNAEKWFAIAAALGQPTRTGSFGESLGNLNKALYETKSAQREAQEKREMMLEKYGMDIGEQQLRMLLTAANQAGQNYRAVSAAQAKAEAAKAPKYDPVEGGGYSLRPGTGGMPPLNGKGQYVVSTSEQAKNVPKGKEFVMAGDETGKVYYGQ